MNSWQRVYSQVAPLGLVLHKARVFIDFILYAAGSVLSRGISFLILPIIMHRIAPEQYGMLSLITAFTVMSTAVIGLGLRQVLSLEYFHASDSKKNQLIRDIITIYSCLAMPLCIVLWLLKDNVNKAFFFNQLTQLQYGAIVVTIFLFFYIELMYQLMQHRRQARNTILMQTMIAALNATISLITVFYFNAGISGVILTQSLASIIATIMAYRYLLQEYTKPHDIADSLSKISYYLPYGLPFVPTIMANWILSSADRWVLGYYCSLHDVGIYAVADLASQLFYAIILLPWAGSYLPYIMQRYQSNPNDIQTIERENKQIMWISMLALSMLISAGLPFAKIVLNRMLPPSYLQALAYIWLLLIGQIFLLGSYFCSTYIQHRKKTYFLAFALFAPAILNLLLNILLAPSYGIMGCTISTLISYVTYFMMTYLFSAQLLLTS